MANPDDRTDWLTDIDWSSIVTEEMLTDALAGALDDGWTPGDAVVSLLAEAAHNATGEVGRHLAEWLSRADIPAAQGAVIQAGTMQLFSALGEWARTAIAGLAPSPERRARRILRKAARMEGFAPSEAEAIRGLVAMNLGNMAALGWILTLARLNRNERKAARKR